MAVDTEVSGQDAAAPFPVDGLIGTAGKDRIELTSWGGMRRCELAGLSLLLHPASELEAGLANLWVRVGERAEPVLGPGVSTLVAPGRVASSVLGLDLTVEYRLAADPGLIAVAVRVSNPGPEPVNAALTFGLDAALAPYGAVRTNEYYVSQYLDLSPVAIPEHGWAVAVRQNMPSSRVPWLIVGSTGVVDSWATDALQLVDDSTGRARLDLSTELPRSRLQHEHALAVVGQAEVTVAAGGSVATSFVAVLAEDHPEASSDRDAAHLLAGLSRAEATTPVGSADRRVTAVGGSLFDRPTLRPRELSADELTSFFPTQHRLVETAGAETDEAGALWAFRSGDEAVTLAAKELSVLRPHGHILRTGCSLAPESEVLTATIWMQGVFLSQLTQGHVSRGRVISGRRTYLGLLQAHGVRVAIRTASGEYLLGLPSAWALRPDRARWIYASDEVTVQVTVTAATDAHQLTLDLEVLSGEVVSATVAIHLALGEDDGQEPAVLMHRRDGAGICSSLAEKSMQTQWNSSGAELRCGGDELLFDDGSSRGLPWLVGQLDRPQRLELEFRAQVVPPSEQVSSRHHLPDLWNRLRQQFSMAADGELATEVEALDASLIWFTHNAFVHHLSPRGLEQFSGGGWGTRDVSQGPVGLLTALGQPAALTATLLELFAAQNSRGDWPQAFDFLPPGGYWSQFDSHGDVVFWPLLALGEQLLGTADASLLDQAVVFQSEAGATEAASLIEHAGRALDYIASHTVTGRSLPAYGHGDWNDSLQPADPDLAHAMASTWTAVLQVHALTQLAAGLRVVGRAEELATRCQQLAECTRVEIDDLLTADGVLSGYGVFAENGSVELLVHPSDRRTGLSWGVLPWIHAIAADLLSPQQASHHLELIRAHLWGPDGARLFDRPAAYRGGPMEIFQRAEGATFWGREIGLMYMHAHLRCAEALARFGDAKGAFEAMMLAVPEGITGRVEQARPRQSTTYYSSSDGVFADRYQAAEQYSALLAGEVELEGGWRIYSSGPGLFLRLLVESVLGVRVRGPRVELDPVIDPRLDGLRVQLPWADGHLQVSYRVGSVGVGVSAVEVDGRPVSTEPLANPYRAAGVTVARADLPPGCAVVIHLGDVGSPAQS